MNALAIEALAAQGILSTLDHHFAHTVARLAGEQRPEVLLAAALVSHQASGGHACLDLRRWAQHAVLLDADGDPVPAPPWPDPDAWLDMLRASPLVSDGSAVAPLVLDTAGRLYLRRYWEHERRLAAAIRARVQQIDVDVDSATLRQGLARMFPAPEPEGVDWQRVAAAMAVQRRFCVISGGPGTGKTFTVVKIVALLVEQALSAGRRPPRVTLLAPTGKAAARLGESIQRAKRGLACAATVKQAIPESAATIHRCLGSVRGSVTRFQHGADHPLLADVVIVDEASMVDVALMSRLLQAVPPQARVILLGDRDQLASVEAGAVLGDVCNTLRPHSHSHALAEWLQHVAGERIPLGPGAPAATGIWDCLVYLTRSYRYRADSGIGALARAINAGDSAAALAMLDGDAAVSRLEPPGEGALHPALRAAIVAGFRPFCQAPDARARLDALEHFRVLCAHRKGPQGLEMLNREVEGALATAGLLQPERRPYSGRPIIVTRNDYQIGLFNGDVGVILDTHDTERRWVAYFIGTEGTQRALSPSRLPPHETVFAMSIHKSQGSELDAVAVVLPDRLSPVLSRELLYTAVTRARHTVTIHAARAVLEETIRRRIERTSGLRDALWEAGK
jgi:exodeoxyribonuclease V alpha subunit